MVDLRDQREGLIYVMRELRKWAGADPGPSDVAFEILVRGVCLDELMVGGTKIRRAARVEQKTQKLAMMR